MTTRVGINGFGRVGRAFLRTARGRDLDIVAVNDLTDPGTLAHLLAYDSTYGRYPDPVRHDGDDLVVGGQRIRVLSERSPDGLDWSGLGVDVVLESTGRFRTQDAASLHLKAGARKVVLSAPGKGVDLTVVMGVNEREYDPARHDVVSGASCTTNCVVPMVRVLQTAFGVERGYLTTVHAYTNDQALIDGPHKDLRRARSAATNIIPTSTGAARSIGLVIPELDGRFDGVAVRVPVEDGSLTDLTVLLSEPASAADINAAFRRAAADGPLSTVLRYTTDPLVSHDIVGDPASCVFDASLTQSTGTLAKVVGWYDNEGGYANRMVDLVELVGAVR
jgi:glyceraldehyde 3-phosphate dehydrogenase (phosphorylating)